MIDFPSSPTINQIVSSTAGSYSWNGSLWVYTEGFAPKMHGLVDTFDAMIDPVKWPSTWSAVWDAGRVRLDCMSSYYYMIETRFIYDLVGSSVTARVTPPALADGRTVVMQYGLPKTGTKYNWFEIEIDCTATQTTIYADRSVDGVWTSGSTSVYNPVDHAWLRIRESSGTVYFETSPDTYRWTTIWSFPSSVYPDSVLSPGQLFLGCGLRYGGNSGSSAYIDNVNAPVPKTETLVDIFDMTVDKVTKWNLTSSDVVWDAGRAKIPAVWNQYEMSTTRRFAFTDTAFTAKVTWPMAAGTYSDMRVNGGSQDVAFDVSSGVLRARMNFVKVGPSVPWTTAHLWLRLRESAGTTYFETSPNGIVWTSFYSAATPAAYNNTLVLMAFSAASSLDIATEFAYIDNVNT